MNQKRILFISKGENAPSTRYRGLAYFSALSSDGWEPEHITVRGNPLLRIKLLKRAGRADVVVILRKTFSAPFLSMLRLCSRNLIFDLDDAIFCRSNGAISRTRRNRFARMANRCRQIWAGNEYLAAASRQYNNEVTTLPTSLVPGKYSMKAEKPAKNIDLVWIGSRSTRKYLDTGLPALENLAGSLPHIRLKIVADFDLKCGRLSTIAVPWSEENEASALSSSHIGIAPMPDNSWTRGKCGLKVLQYMAAGLPVVSSAAGVNEEIVEHGVTGFLADNAETWQKAIEELINKPDLRRVMGEAGRKRVMGQYSVEATYPKMARALDSLFRKH
ncbi:MAG TPA: glycosyltransferase family 1 protein [Desulfobacteraceae bacterium]|nr:glycosyltransferase family 1 protein [Desulfobacteraceae bacterium]